MLRHPFARSAWARDDGGDDALLFVSGEAYSMDTKSAHVLASYEALDDAALAKLDDSGRAALASLIASGHYHLKRASRARP